MSDVIYLNVGGCLFGTRRSTLEHSDSFFSSLVAHDDGATPQRTYHGTELVELFVDRDPTHFRHVLNWMRGVRTVPLVETTALHELRHEAEYYALTDMVHVIDARLRTSVPSVAQTLSTVSLQLGRP